MEVVVVVVVIQDASRDLSPSAVKEALDGLSLYPGDELTLLGVLDQAVTPSMSPFSRISRAEDNHQVSMF